MSRPRQSLLRDDAGAALVFGIFFVMFLIAAVWSLWGTIETVLYRERVQDAADAAAFSAAVVNARGMNVIALVNMTMAAVLAILVALRLALTLGYIAVGICLALSSVTMGATSSAVPPLQSLNKALSTAADKVERPIEQLLELLHQVGAVTAKLVPLGANLRVVDLVASHHEAIGVAIPSRMTLPVEDDEFAVLCAHAGALTGTLAIAPLSPLLPGPAKQGFGAAVGKLAAAGSAWFCGGGSPPELDDDERTRTLELPRFSSQDECAEKASAASGADESEAAYRAPCERAAAELLASLPDRDGRCRAGEPLCPTDCEGSARASCPPLGFSNCLPEQADELARHAQVELGASTVLCGEGSPYAQRLLLAREQCRPETLGGRAGLGGFAWIERTIVREYVWNELRASWVEDEARRSVGAERSVRRKDRDLAYPCGERGVIGASYERASNRPVCEGNARCLAYGALGDAPCPRARPRERRERLREQSTEVLDLLRCAYRSEAPRVKTPPMDMSQEFSSREGETSPFRLERARMLGTSDFQLRALVIGREPPSAAQRVVALATPDGPRGERVEAEVVALASKLGRVGLAQAEYYFDWTGLGKDGPKDQTKRADVTEWLWNMAWRARLRPFRLDRREGSSELDCKTLPKAASALCGDAQQALKLLGGG